MAGKSYITETRESAYRIWREEGQNIERTIRAMKRDHGIPVTKPTIYAWIEKFNWVDRATRAETEEQRVKDVIVSDEGKILSDLERQKEKYERFFESLGETCIDNQAMYAYTNLVKTIADIKGKTSALKATLFLDFLRDLIEWLSKNDPDSVAIIEKNFDDFIGFAKEKYAR